MKVVCKVRAWINGRRVSAELIDSIAVDGIIWTPEGARFWYVAW